MTPEVKYIVHVDPEIKDFIPEYIEHREKDCFVIAEHLKNDKFSEIQILGHKMKGSGKIYGMDKISEIGNGLEEFAKRKDANQIEKLRSELLDFLNNLEVR